MKRTRNPFRRLWIRWRLRRICRALEIDLWPEVKAYVLHGDVSILRGGPRNGKTTAVLLDILVYKRIVVARGMYSGERIFDLFYADPDMFASPTSLRWYRDHLAGSVSRCLAAGIRVSRRREPK